MHRCLPDLLAEVLRVPLVGVSPIEVPDPFWHPLHGFPYSAAVHPFIASGMAPPLVRAGRSAAAPAAPAGTLHRQAPCPAGPASASKRFSHMGTPLLCATWNAPPTRFAVVP